MNDADRELARRLVRTATEAFRDHAWICPWQGFGYFADKKDRGVRGANMVGALAVAAGVVKKSYGPDDLLYGLVAWRDRNPDWKDRWHITYGIDAGWRGLQVAASDYQAWPQDLDGGWARSGCAIDYRFGYAIGRRAARECGLPVPPRPDRRWSKEVDRDWSDVWRKATTKEGRAPLAPTLF